MLQLGRRTCWPLASPPPPPHHTPAPCALRPQPFHGAQEVFLSDHQDDLFLRSVMGRVTVHDLNDFCALGSRQDPQRDFYSRLMYKVGARGWGWGTVKWPAVTELAGQVAAVAVGGAEAAAGAEDAGAHRRQAWEALPGAVGPVRAVGREGRAWLRPATPPQPPPSGPHHAVRPCRLRTSGSSRSRYRCGCPEL
jgi:hypothetical protein